MPRRNATRKRPQTPSKRRLNHEPLERRELLAATPIEVLAAGRAGDETVVLEVAGAEVRRWNNVGGDFDARQFQTLSYTHPTSVTADDVVVRMLGATGPGRDLRVDGVRVNGAKFEAESPNTWNTGAWDNDLQAIVPSHAQSEILYAYNGELRFSATDASTIRVFAAGNTGSERMRLAIDGEVVQTWFNVRGDYDNRQFRTFTYTHPSKVDPSRIRVLFDNDGRLSNGGDRNLRVDAIEVDGRRYESESPTTFGTGTWSDNAIRSRFHQDERLQANGYFQYTARPEGGSTVVVWAAGRSGQEEMVVRADGGELGREPTVGGNYDTRRFEPLALVHPRQLTLDDLEVALVNDAAGRDLKVDAIELDGVRYQAEAQSTYSTGGYREEVGIAPGFLQSEILYANGVLQFGQDPAAAGQIALGATQYSVGEGDGFVDVEFVRTASRGTVTIDYTTVNGTAIAGQDYTAASGVAVLADGQLRTTVRVPIRQDNRSEGSETFNVAGDRITGGAFLAQPRTTTVTIRDDEAPSPGDGVGLRGEYYAGRNFGTLLLERTDPTVNFDWGNGSPSPLVPDNDFSVRWAGEIEPLYSETYTFETRTDDGVRLWVNDVQIIDQWINQAPTTHTGTITLQAGVKYDIRMEVYEDGGGAVAQLRWSSPSQAKQIVPASQLYSELIVSAEPNFAPEELITGLTQPTAIDFAAAGGQSLMYIAQKNGLVRLAIDGQLQSGQFLDYRDEVNGVRDRGLLGIAAHPDFVNNPYVYLLYTYDPPEAEFGTGLAARDAFGNRGSRLTRVTADASNGYRTIVPGSEVVLLGTNSTWDNISDPAKDSTNDMNLPPSGSDGQGGFIPDILITDSQSHTIGALDFGPDGSLYVTNGDGTSYGRVDPRTIRTQTLDNLSGKLLRIDPLTGDGLSDNPYFTGDATDDRSKIASYGLRNPFRLAVHPDTGVPYIGDVGWTRWEEINAGVGQNFGWPYYEGGAGNNSRGGDGVNRQTGGYKDLPEAQLFYNSQAADDAAPPVWSRNHSAGGVAIVLGDFYTGNRYPSAYDDALFFTDFGDNVIRAITLDTSGEFERELPVLGDIGPVVEMSMGPDGFMYYVDISGKIGRIVNQPTANAAMASAPSSLPLAIGVGEERGFAFVAEPVSLTSAAAISVPSAAPAATPLAADQALLLLDPQADSDTSPKGEASFAAADQEADRADETDPLEAAFATL